MNKDFSLKTKILSIIFIFGILYFPNAFSSGSITNLGILPGGTFSQATGVSADGSTVVGLANSGANTLAVRNSGTGWVSLGSLGGTSSSALAVNANGTVIVGQSNSLAFMWTAAGGMVSLGTLGGATSEAEGVNGDGSVIVGLSNDATNSGFAYRWTAGTGMVNLGSLFPVVGALNSGAQGVSSDGSVVVGFTSVAGGLTHGFQWTQAGGMIDIGTLGGTNSNARAVSGNGLVVVGTSTAGANNHAFLWTQAGGMVDINNATTSVVSSSYAANTDGSVIVGQCTYIPDAFANRAFRWTQASGMILVEDWLRQNGVTVPTNITARATGVSADGSVVVGILGVNQAFIARVNPVLGSGLISLADKFQSLASTIPSATMEIQLAELALSGIHGHPLENRIEKGSTTGIWVAGDWGGQHRIRDGIAEAGFAKRVVHNWQAGLGIGKSLRRHRLLFAGKQRFDGTYLLAEILGELPIKNLWLTVDAFHQWGKSKNRRGYLNAGNLDSSYGENNSYDNSLRARIDWDKILQVQDMSFTPYAQAIFNFAKQNAYTETGGGFPAYFDGHKQRVQEARIGVNEELPICGSLTLLGTIEGAHRFEKAGLNKTGFLLGLFGFNIPGSIHQQNWLRGMIGIRAPLEQGNISLNLNATTKGQDDRLWIGADYHLSF